MEKNESFRSSLILLLLGFARFGFMFAVLIYGFSPFPVESVQLRETEFFHWFRLQSRTKTTTTGATIFQCSWDSISLPNCSSSSAQVFLKYLIPGLVFLIFYKFNLSFYCGLSQVFPTAWLRYLIHKHRTQFQMTALIAEQKHVFHKSYDYPTPNLPL